MYEEWAERWRVLGDPTRLHIVRLLSVRDACVCELLPVGQSAVSQHLQKLKYAGFVRDYSEKSWSFYTLRLGIPAAITSLFEELPIPEAEVSWRRRRQTGATCPMRVADPSDRAAGVSE